MESGSEVWVRDKSDNGTPTSKKDTWNPHVVLSKIYFESGESSVLTKNAEQEGAPMQFSVEAGLLESDDVKLRNDVASTESGVSDLRSLPFLNEPELLSILKRCCFTKVSQIKLNNHLMIVMPIKKVGEDHGVRDFVSSACSFHSGKNVTGWNNLSNTKKYPFLQHLNKSFAMKSIADAGSNNRSMIDLSSVLNEEAGGSLLCVDRSIILCGESNFDKSQLVERVLSTVGDGSSAAIVENLFLAHKVLRAFTCADSLHAKGQNCAIHCVTCQLDEEEHIVGGEIAAYLMDYRRVASQAPCETNFFIFCELLRAMSEAPSELADHFSHLKLSGSSTVYQYCKSLDGASFASYRGGHSTTFPVLLDAMTQLGLSQELVEQVIDILGGLLHCGQLTLVPTFDLSGEGCSVSNANGALSLAAGLLGVEPALLEQCITTRTAMIVKGESIEKKLDVLQAKQTLDSLVCAIYRRVVESVVRSINASLQADPDTVQSSVHVVDLLPFVNHSHSGQHNNFYGLFQNYTNEFLHRLSISHMLKYILLDAEQEEVSSFYQNYDFSGPVSLSSVNRRLDGCFESITLNVVDSLDEMCKFQAHPTDKNFAVKLYSKITSSDLIGSLVSSLNSSYQYLTCSSIQQQSSLFTIRHFYGKVEYSMEGFVVCNHADLSPTIYSMFGESVNSILRGIKPAVPGSASSATNATPKSKQQQRSPITRTNSFIPSPKGSSYQLLGDEDQRRLSPKRSLTPKKDSPGASQAAVQLTPTTSGTSSSTSTNGLKRVGSQFIDPNELSASGKKRESSLSPKRYDDKSMKRTSSRSNVMDSRTHSPKPNRAVSPKAGASSGRNQSPNKSALKISTAAKTSPRDGDTGISPMRGKDTSTAAGGSVVSPSRGLGLKNRSLSSSSAAAAGESSNNLHSLTSPRAVKAVVTVAMQYREQLSALHCKINNSVPYYICHVLPLGVVASEVRGSADHFNQPRVMQQLQYCGIWEYVRLSRQLFPVQLEHHLFIERYKFLVNINFNSPSFLMIPSISHKQCPPQVARQRCYRLCTMLVSYKGDGPLDPSFLSQIGSTKVFLKANDYIYLENARYFAVEYLQQQLSFKVNAMVVRMIARRRYRKKVKAVVTIQRVVRGGMSRRYHKMLFAAMAIQKFVFQHVRGRYGKNAAAARVIQRHIRGAVCRMKMVRFRALLKAVVPIQRRFRHKYYMRSMHHVVNRMRKMAIKIQCAFRRYSALQYVRYINEVMNGHHNMSGDILIASELRGFRRRQQFNEQRVPLSKSGSHDEYGDVVVAEMDTVLESVDRTSLMLEFSAKIQMFRENTYEMGEEIRSYTTPPEVKPAREEVPPLRCDVEKAAKFLVEYTDKYVANTCDLYHEVMFVGNTLDYGYNLLLAEKLIPLKFMDKLMHGCASEKEIPVELRKRSSKSAPPLADFNSDHPVFGILDANIETLRGIVSLAEAELAILQNDVAYLNKSEKNPGPESPKYYDFDNDKPMHNTGSSSNTMLFKKKRAVYYMSKIKLIAEQLREYYCEYVTHVVRTFGMTSAYYRDYKEDLAKDSSKDPYVYHLACLFNEKRPLLATDKLKTIGVTTVASATKVIYSPEELPLNDFIKEQNENRCFLYKGLLIKYSPYAPGVEFTVNSLFHILCRSRFMVCNKMVRGTASYNPSKVVDSSYQSHIDTTGLFAISKYTDYKDGNTYNGQIDRQLTLRDVYSNPILIEQLDGNTVSACILLSMILATSVVHPSNVMVQPIKSEASGGKENSIRIIGLTNDAALTDGLFSPRLGQARNRAQRYLNCLYYLPQMDEPLDSGLLKMLTGGSTRVGGHTSSVEIICYWLHTLATQLAHYDSLGLDGFGRADLKSLNLPFKLPQGSVLGVFQRLQVVCSVLMQPNQQVTHHMLLEELFPDDALYYYRKRNANAAIDPNSRIGVYHSRFARNNGEKLEYSADMYDAVPYHVLCERAYLDSPVATPMTSPKATSVPFKLDAPKRKTHWVLKTVTEKVKRLEKKKSIKLYPKTVKKLVTVTKKRMVQQVVQVPRTIVEMVENVRTIVIEESAVVAAASAESVTIDVSGTPTKQLHNRELPFHERETDSESPGSDDETGGRSATGPCASGMLQNGHSHVVPSSAASENPGKAETPLTFQASGVPPAESEVKPRSPMSRSSPSVGPARMSPSLGPARQSPTMGPARSSPSLGPLGSSTSRVSPSQPPPGRRIYNIDEFDDYDEDEDEDGSRPNTASDYESFYGNAKFSEMLSSLAPLKSRPLNTQLRNNTEANKSFLSSYSLLGSNSVFSSEYNMNQSFIANNGAPREMRKNSFIESLPRVSGDSFMYNPRQIDKNNGNDFMESIRRVPSAYMKTEYSPVTAVSPLEGESTPPVKGKLGKKGVSFHQLSVVDEDATEESDAPPAGVPAPSVGSAGANQDDVIDGRESDVRTDVYMSPSSTAAQTKQTRHQTNGEHQGSSNSSIAGDEALLHLPTKARHTVDSRAVDLMTPFDEGDEEAFLTDGSSKKLKISPRSLMKGSSSKAQSPSPLAAAPSPKPQSPKTQTIVEMVEVTREVMVDEVREVEEEYEEEVVVDEVIQIEREIETEFEVEEDVTTSKYVEEELPEEEEESAAVLSTLTGAASASLDPIPEGADDDEATDEEESESARDALERYQDGSLVGLQRYVATLAEVTSEFMNAIDFASLANNEGIFQNPFIKENKRAESEKALCSVIGTYLSFVVTLCLNKVNEKQLQAIFNSRIQKSRLLLTGTSLLMTPSGVRKAQSVSFFDPTAASAASVESAAGDDMKPPMAVKVVDIANLDTDACNALKVSKIVKDLKTFLGIDVKFSSLDVSHDDFKSSANAIANNPLPNAVYEVRDEVNENSGWMLQYKDLMLKLPLYLPAKLQPRERDIITLITEQSRTKRQIEMISLSLLKQYTEILLQFPSLVRHTCMLVSRGVFVKHRLMPFKILGCGGCLEKYLEVVVYLVSYDPTLLLVKSLVSKHFLCDKIVSMSNYRSYKFPLLTVCVNKSAVLNRALIAEDNFSEELSYNPVVSTYQGEDELVFKAVAYGLPASEEELAQHIFHFDKCYKKTGETIFHRTVTRISRPGDVHDQVFFLALEMLKKREDKKEVESFLWERRTTTQQESVWVIALRRKSATAHIIKELNENWGGKRRISTPSGRTISIPSMNYSASTMSMGGKSMHNVTQKSFVHSSLGTTSTSTRDMMPSVASAAFLLTAQSSLNLASSSSSPPQQVRKGSTAKVVVESPPSKETAPATTASSSVGVTKTSAVVEVAATEIAFPVESPPTQKSKESPPKKDSPPVKATVKAKSPAGVPVSPQTTRKVLTSSSEGRSASSPLPSMEVPASGTPSVSTPATTVGKSKSSAASLFASVEEPTPEAPVPAAPVPAAAAVVPSLASRRLPPPPPEAAQVMESVTAPEQLVEVPVSVDVQFNRNVEQQDTLFNRKLPEIPASAAAAAPVIQLQVREEVEAEVEVEIPLSPVSPPVASKTSPAYLSTRRLPPVPVAADADDVAAAAAQKTDEQPVESLIQSEIRLAAPDIMESPVIAVVVESTEVKTQPEVVTVPEPVAVVEHVVSAFPESQPTVESVDVHIRVPAESELVKSESTSSKEGEPKRSPPTKRIVPPVQSLSRESSAATFTGGDLSIDVTTSTGAEQFTPPKLMRASTDSTVSPKSQPTLVVIPLSPGETSSSKSESNKSVRTPNAATRSIEEELIVKAVAYGLLATKDELTNKIYNFDKTYLKTGENILHSALLNVIERNDAHDRTFFLALRVLRERLKTGKMTKEAVDNLIWNVRTVPLNENLWNIAQRRNPASAHIIDELIESWDGVNKGKETVAATSVPFASPQRRNSEKLNGGTPQSPGRSIDEELIVKAASYGLPASKDELTTKVYNFDKTFLKTGENILHRSLMNIIEKGDSHDRTFFLALRVLKERIKTARISPEAADFLIWHTRTAHGESIWSIAQKRRDITTHVVEELNENWGGRKRVFVDAAKSDIAVIDVNNNRRSIRTISPSMATTSNDSTYTPEATILTREASASALARDAAESPNLAGGGGGGSERRSSRRLSGSRDSPFTAFSPAGGRNSKKTLPLDSPQTTPFGVASFGASSSQKSTPFSPPKHPGNGNSSSLLLSSNSGSGKFTITDDDVFVIKRKPSTLNNEVKQKLLFEEAQMQQHQRRQQMSTEQDEY